MRHNAVAGIRVESLSFAYGQRKALDDVTFSVDEGSFAALLGLNGAGKSTLFSLMTRLFVSRKGRIEFAGTDLAHDPGRSLAKLGVVFQQQTLDLDLTVLQNLRYFAALHGMSRIEANERIDAALTRLDLAERAGEPVRQLNGGHRRRTEIARALVHSPTVLLLDEPTAGLDAATRHSITAQVHELCADEGLTVLWATHLVDEVEPDDQLIVLHRGKVISEGLAQDISAGKPLVEKFLELTHEATV